jgi:hypothetical protein
MSQLSQPLDPDHDTIDVAANLAAIKDKLKKVLLEAGRPAGAVTLTAVSKQHGPERIRAALNAGHCVYGENRVQEAMSKWLPLREEYEGIELRLIGPLQTNKTKEAVAFFDVIETVDRPKLAGALAKEMEKQDRRLKLLIQVNTGQEDQKAGVAPAEADSFIVDCRDRLGLPIDGLMCIPPVEDDPSPHFALLAKIAERNGIKKLSMGMSADYAIAAQLGATHVRVGSGVFGARPKA